MNLIDAVLQTSLLRLRSILMTTSTMIFSTLALILSSKARHKAQRAIAIVPLGGLLLGTSFILFVLSTVCYAIKSFNDRLMRQTLFSDS